MNNEISPTAESKTKPQKKSWRRKLVICGGVFLLGLIGIYSYVSSGTFIRNHVLSAVQEKLQQPIKAEDVSFSLFSGIEIQNLAIGEEPYFLDAEKVKVSYDLLSLMSEKLVIDEITLENTTLDVVINRNGDLAILENYVADISDDVTEQATPVNKPAAPVSSPKNGKAQPAVLKDSSKIVKKEKPKFKSPKFLLDINKINFKNLDVRIFKDDSKVAKRFELKLKGLNISLPRLASTEEFSFALQTALSCRAGEKTEVKNADFKLLVTGQMSDGFLPEMVKIDFSAEGLEVFSEKAQLPVKVVKLESTLTFAEDKISIEIFKIYNPQASAAILLGGDVFPSKQAFDLTFELKKLDATLLDLLAPLLAGNKSWQAWQRSLKEASGGRVAGFTNTEINYLAEIEKKNSASALSFKGEFSLKSLPLAKLGGKSRVSKVDMSLVHDISLNDKTNILSVNKLQIVALADRRRFLNFKLDKALRLNLETKQLSSNGNDKIAFDLERFDLNYLKAFIKEKKRQGLQSGEVSLALVLRSEAGGTKFHIDLNNFAIENLALKTSDAELHDLSLRSQLHLQLSKLDDISINKCSVRFSQRGQTNASILLSGQLNADKIAANIRVEELTLTPGLGRLLPAEISKKFGMKNINMNSDRIDVSYQDGQLAVKGYVDSSAIALGGEAFTESTISQRSNFNISLDKDQRLTLNGISLLLKQGNGEFIDVRVKGYVDLNFVRDDSQVFINIPNSVNVDQWMALLKEKEVVEQKISALPVEVKGPKSTTQSTTVQKKKDVLVTTSKGQVLKAEKPLKLALRFKAKQVRFENQSFDDINAVVQIDGSNYTLEEASLVSAGTTLTASAVAEMKEIKSIQAEVKTSGFMSLAALDAILNKDSEKKLAGKFRINSMSLKTSGKTNDELMQALKAKVQIDVENLQVHNYAKMSGYLKFPLEQILGVTPNEIDFRSGDIDLTIADSVVTINRCQFIGDVLLLNPHGSGKIGTDKLDFDMSAEFGFGGGAVLRQLTGILGGSATYLMKHKKMQKFNKHFQFSEALKLFMMMDKYRLVETVSLDSKSDKSIVSVFLNKSFASIAKKVIENKPEQLALVDSLQRAIKGKTTKEKAKGFLDSVINVVKERDRRKGKKDDKASKIISIFDAITGGSRKKEKEPQQKPDVEQEEKPQEKNKQEKSKEKPIDRANDLIKDLENLFR